MKKCLMILMGLCLFLSSYATSFVQGDDYEVINPKTAPSSSKIEVVEFFSLSCPWCFQFEPAVEQWQKTKPKDVDFYRVHVTFESNGTNLAKAYYTARALDLTPKINMELFKLVQEQRSKLDENTLATLFAKEGVNKEKFLSSFKFSTGLNTLIMRGETLMENYKVLAVPSIVVAGKYKTDSGMAKGDAYRFIEIAKFLIEKARAEKKVT